MHRSREFPGSSTRARSACGAPGHCENTGKMKIPLKEPCADGDHAAGLAGIMPCRRHATTRCRMAVVTHGCHDVAPSIPEKKSADCAQLPTSSRPSAETGSPGMVLASILILLGLIIGITISSQVASHLALRHAERRLSRAELRAAAFEAAWNSLQALPDAAALHANHTNEPWARPVIESLPNGIETLVVIRDEQRLFDINNLSATFGDEAARKPFDIMTELLARAGGQNADGQAVKLRAWFLLEGEPASPRAGPLSAPQAQASVSPHPGRIMESPAELARILGAGPDRPAILSLVSVLPMARTRPLPVNVNTAGPEVLEAVIGAHDDAAARALCRARDAHPILSMSQVSDLLGPDRIRACRDYLDVKTSFFSMHARAERNGQAVDIFGLAHRTDEGDIEILRWTPR